MRPKPPQYKAPEKPSKIILRFILKILGYPYSIVKKYNDYNIRVGEIVNELKDNELNRIRVNNGKLVLLFIYLPMTLGLFFSGLSIYSHKQDYKNYWNRLTRTEKTSGVFDSVTKKVHKVQYAVTGFPGKKDDFVFIFYGYIVTLLGARFLSMNPAFKEEEKISNIFSSLGYIDAEGSPWKVTWTPDAIQIISFNCDPIQLCSNTRFWSTINFPPGAPKVSKTNMNKFIVTRAYELSPTMIFSFDQ